MSNINQYPLIATQINDEDFYDVDYWTGSAFETRKISGATLKAVLGGIDQSIYNTDGTLTADRVLNGGNFEITFEGIKKWKSYIEPTTADIGYEHVVDASAMLGTDVVWKIDCIGNNICSIQMTKAGKITVTPSPTEAYNLPQTNGFRPSGGFSVYTTDDQTPSQGSFQNMDFMAEQIAPFLDSGRNFASTQWGSTASSVPFPNGTIANGFNFFVPADKSVSGTTSWDEYDLAFGIDLTFTGTSGTANVNVVTGTFLATFNTDLDTTASDFVALHFASLNALGVRVLYNGGATIRFCASEAHCNSVAITNVTGDLSGTRINPFTGVDAAAIDHVLIPYEGTEYEGKRLQHRFRVNFGIETGSTQTAALSLRRFSDDSIIGSEIKVVRDQDVEGNQFNFISYTASATDPFVTGGFYFALRNDSGTTLNINGAIGIYIETSYETDIVFP